MGTSLDWTKQHLQILCTGSNSFFDNETFLRYMYIRHMFEKPNQYIKSNQGVHRFVIGEFHCFTMGKLLVYICFEGILVIMCMMLFTLTR